MMAPREAAPHPPNPPSMIDEAALAKAATALGLTLPADRRPAVLDGARHLENAARLLRAALARMADHDGG